MAKRKKSAGAAAVQDNTANNDAAEATSSTSAQEDALPKAAPRQTEPRSKYDMAGSAAHGRERLSQLADRLQGAWGDRAMLPLANAPSARIHRLPFGILTLDWKTRGGLVIGRINRLWGKKSTLKTTLCLRALRSAQQSCRHCKTTLVTSYTTGAVDCRCPNPRYWLKDKNDLAWLPGEAAVKITMGELPEGTEMRRVKGAGVQPILTCAPSDKIAAAGKRDSVKPRDIVFEETFRCEPMRSLFLDGERCLPADAEIFDPETGQFNRVSDVVQHKRVINVLAFDTEQLRFSSQRISGWHVNGRKPTVRVFTTNGEYLTTTRNHKWLVCKGPGNFAWVEAQHLTVGDFVCRPRAVSAPEVTASDTSVSADVARLTGYMIGDGSLGGSSGVDTLRFYHSHAEVIDDVRRIVEANGAFFRPMDGYAGKFNIVEHGCGGDRKSADYRGKLRAMFAEMGILGDVARFKTIPAQIWRGGYSAVVNVLAGLIATDGTVNKCRPTVGYSSASRVLVMQMRWLLRRIGIEARMSVCAPEKPAHAPTHVLSINGIRNIRRLAEHVPVVGRKGEAIRRWAGAVNKAVPKQSGFDYYPGYVQFYAAGPEYDNTSEVYFDRIARIEDAGEQETFDVSVPEYHNYVASDFVVHNTCDEAWAKANGVDTSLVTLIGARWAEHNLSVIEESVLSQDADFVVIDSTSVLEPEANLHKAVGERPVVGARANLMGAFVRRLLSSAADDGLAARYKPTILCTAQVSTHGIGSGVPPWLAPTDGHAWEHALSLDIKMIEAGYTYDSTNTVARFGKFNFEVTKNKAGGSPGVTGVIKFWLRAEDGHPVGDSDDVGVVMDYARKLGEGYISAQGSSLTVFSSHFKGGNIKFSRVGDCAEFLYENASVYADLRMRVLDRLMADNASLEVPAEAAPAAKT